MNPADLTNVIGLKGFRWGKVVDSFLILIVDRV